MKIFLIILFIFFVILLFPIPLKIKLIYFNKDFKIFIYNKQLNLTKDHDKKRKHHFSNKDNKCTCDDKEEDKAIFKNIDYKNIFLDLKNNKFKIKLKFYCDTKFSFEDAAKTAISYGYFHQLFILIYFIAKSFFKIKSFDYNLNYEFNKNFFNTKVECIFYVTFAKIIYIGYLILKNTKNKNEEENFTFQEST